MWLLMYAARESLLGGQGTRSQSLSREDVLRAVQGLEVEVWNEAVKSWEPLPLGAPLQLSRGNFALVRQVGATLCEDFAETRKLLLDHFDGPFLVPLIRPRPLVDPILLVENPQYWADEGPDVLS